MFGDGAICVRAGVFLRGENVLARCWGLRTVVGFSHWVESGESRLDISLYSVEVLYKKKQLPPSSACGIRSIL